MQRRSTAGALLSMLRRFISWLKTREARCQATLGANTRITHSGDVVNIAADKDRIHIGSNCVIAGQLLIFAHAGSIEIGDLVFVGRGSHIWSSSSLKIGDRVLISHGVEIHDTESHPTDHEARARQAFEIVTRGHPIEIEGIKSAPIVIGNDVWIGFGATIRRGVTIGDRAIIGARAIVDRDVPAGVTVRTSSTQSSQKEA